MSGKAAGGAEAAVSFQKGSRSLSERQAPERMVREAGQMER